MNDYRKKRKIADKIYTRLAFHEFVKKMILEETSDERKLNLISYLAQWNANCNMGKYSDEVIESELVKIAQTIDYIPSGTVQKNSVLHIMTMAYAVGGHTKIVRDWITIDKKRKNSVVITGDMKSTIPPDFGYCVKNNGGDYIELSTITLLEKAKELRKIAENYEKIVLHIHTFDVVPILAFSHRDWKIPVYFMNQANYRFSLGMSITDCFLGICDYDVQKAVRYRGIKKAEVLPVPVLGEKNNDITTMSNSNKLKIKNELKKKYRFPSNARIIISMGAPFKYQYVLGYDFPDFLTKLVKSTEKNVYVFVIGAENKRDSRWKKLEKKTNKRARALPILSRSEVDKWMMVADVYITSFPMTSSGKEDALRNGAACFSLRVTNRCVEYEDHNHCRTIDELIGKITDYLSGKEPYFHIEQKRNIIAKNPKLWCDYLDNIFSKPIGHKIHSFKSVRVVSKEEIINYQLLHDLGKMESYPGWARLTLEEQVRISLVAGILGLKLLRY